MTNLSDHPWTELIEAGYQSFLSGLPTGTISEEHLHNTPKRVSKALAEFFTGVTIEPATVLNTAFEESTYDQMVVVTDIEFVSFCAHHILPFWGKAKFAYIPKGRIVGLSKIPRLVEVLSARPQVQEKLAGDIVRVFSEVISPDCAVMLEAFHTCMAVRGVRKKAITRTTALRGEFQKEHVKNEFLHTVGSLL